MWEKLISLAADWIKTKPRKDLARALMNLRHAMAYCQEQYEKYRGTVGHAAALRAPGQRDPAFAWRISISQLGDALSLVGGILEIYSPAAHRQLRKYLHDEMRTMQGFEPMEITARALGADASKIGISRDHLNQEFGEALQHLDAFIRDNFKPEELR